MPALTIKNIPDDLYIALKQTAEGNHRSINSEVIVRLKQLLLPQPVNIEEKLADIRKLRASVIPDKVSADDIDAAINDGRP